MAVLMSKLFKRDLLESTCHEAFYGSLPVIDRMTLVIDRPKHVPINVQGLTDFDAKVWWPTTEQKT